MINYIPSVIATILGFFNIIAEPPASPQWVHLLYHLSGGFFLWVGGASYIVTYNESKKK